jgi:uncharacterized protein (DUF1697 family)
MKFQRTEVAKTPHDRGRRNLENSRAKGYLRIPTTMAAIPTTIVRTGEEWAKMASKYGYGIDADEATKDELVEFVQTVIYLHETGDLTDTDLWLAFREQIDGFTVENFRTIRTDMRSNLRKHLLKEVFM